MAKEIATNKATNKEIRTRATQQQDSKNASKWTGIILHVPITKVWIKYSTGNQVVKDHKLGHGYMWNKTLKLFQNYFSVLFHM